MLRRRVIRRVLPLPRVGRVLPELRGAQITDHGTAVGHQQDVSRLHVDVHGTHPMDRPQPVCRVGQPPNGLRDRQLQTLRGPPVQLVRQAATGGQLHHAVDRCRVRRQVVGLEHADVGFRAVVHACSQLQLPREALLISRPERHRTAPFSAHHLHRATRSRADVGHGVHFSERSTAKVTVNAVAAAEDRRVRFERGRGGLGWRVVQEAWSFKIDGVVTCSGVTPASCGQTHDGASLAACRV